MSSMPPDPFEVNVNDLNLPFAAQAPVEHTEAMEISGGCVLLSAVLPTADGGKQPALIFRFARPTGSGFYPPMLLVLEPTQMRGFPALVEQAVTRALEVARGGE